MYLKKSKKFTKLMKFDYKKEYCWLITSQAYFQCALVTARILYEKSKGAVSKNSPRDYCLEKIYGRDYSQCPNFLIFPIIFNFKHGIEIYLKAIIGIKNSEFNKEHDLCKLVGVAGVNDEKIEKIIKKYVKANLLLPKNNKCDTKNQFERYPQGSSYDNVNMETEDGIGEEKITELIEDILYVYQQIRKITFNIEINKKK